MEPCHCFSLQFLVICESALTCRCRVSFDLAFVRFRLVCDLWVTSAAAVGLRQRRRQQHRQRSQRQWWQRRQQQRSTGGGGGSSGSGSSRGRQSGREQEPAFVIFAAFSARFRRLVFLAAAMYQGRISARLLIGGAAFVLLFWLGFSFHVQLAK